jgi:glycosyltransferase involved in cell wall biosynthesis
MQRPNGDAHARDATATLLLVSDALGTPAYPRGVFQYTTGLLPVLKAAGWSTALVIEEPGEEAPPGSNPSQVEAVARLANIYQYLSGSHYRSELREHNWRRRFSYERRAQLQRLVKRAGGVLPRRRLLDPGKVMMPNQPARLAFIPEKLRAFASVDWFIPLGRFYTDSVMRAVYNVRPPRLNARAFDAVIIDTPLYVELDARPGVPIIGVIHDLVPIQDPTMGAGWRRLFMRKLEATLAQATRLVFVSDATRQDADRHFPGLLDRVPSYILHPIASPDLCAAAEQTKPSRRPDDGGLCPGKPYMVALVSFEQRKNTAVLVQAWQKIGDRADLVIIGQMNDEFRKFLNARRGANIKNLGLVSDAEKIALICGARALVMPSHAEGFGIPIIEAGVLGTPVICSDIAVFREVTAGFAQYFDPYSVESLVRAVERALDHPSSADTDAQCLRRHCLSRYTAATALPVFAAALGGKRPSSFIPATASEPPSSSHCFEAP